MQYLIQLISALGRVFLDSYRFIGAVFVAVFVFLDAASSLVYSLLTRLVTLATSLFTSSGLMALDSSNVITALTLANTFFPVSEMFAAMVFLFGTWTVAVLYRLIKSYIPTLS